MRALCILGDRALSSWEGPESVGLLMVLRNKLSEKYIVNESYQVVSDLGPCGNTQLADWFLECINNLIA